MKMSKTCQRLNERLLVVLSQVDNEAKQVDGFSHLSHTVHFDCFPGSLLVLCHFIDAQMLLTAKNNHVETKLQKKLSTLLFKKGILLKDPKMNLKLQGSI